MQGTMPRLEAIVIDYMVDKIDRLMGMDVVNCLRGVSIEGEWFCLGHRDVVHCELGM